MKVPDYITPQWIDSLTDDNLLAADLLLHKAFSKLEHVEKTRLGNAYDLMHGPADLMSAWDRWARVNSAARERKLSPRRR